MARCLESIRAQTFDDYEVLVVDDGSSDHTRDVVEKYVAEGWVQYLFQDNAGAAAARNLGLLRARGELVAFQDSDDEWLPEKLEKQVSALESADDSVGLVYTDMLRISANGDEEYRLAPDVQPGVLVDPATNEYQFFGIGLATILVKKDLVEKVGAFNIALPRYIDLELFIRLSDVCSFVHLQEALFKYHETPGISSNRRANAEAREKLLQLYGERVQNNQVFVARQYLHIAINYWKVGEKRRALSWGGRAMSKSGFHWRYDMAFLMITIASPELIRLLPEKLRRTVTP